MPSGRANLGINAKVPKTIGAVNGIKNASISGLSTRLGGKYRYKPALRCPLERGKPSGRAILGINSKVLPAIGAVGKTKNASIPKTSTRPGGNTHE